MTSSGKECWQSVIHPLSSRKSAAQMFLERSLGDSLPSLPKLKEEFLTPDTRQTILHDKSKEKRNYDQQRRVLSPLHPGPIVAIHSRRDTDWSLLGTILELRVYRTFLVRIDQGSVLIRNKI